MRHKDRHAGVFQHVAGGAGTQLAVALSGYGAVLKRLPHASADNELWLRPGPDLAGFGAIVASMRDVMGVPEQALSRLTMPVSGLVGSVDPLKETIEGLAQCLPDYMFEVLPDTDHAESSMHPSLSERIAVFLDGAQG